MRHVYQNSSGGKQLVPLELGGRIIGRTSTPRFAQMVSWKYSQSSAERVSEDLTLNHGRAVSRGLVQTLSAEVACIAQDKEFEWGYALPEFREPVSHIAISRDGAMVPMVGGKWRETMSGTLSFYNRVGQRMHTIYTACAPEHGKHIFNEVLDMEIAQIKALYPSLPYVGIADGAIDNWRYLSPLTDVQITDFYHATQYLADIAPYLYAKVSQQKLWLDKACHELKNDKKGVKNIIDQLKAYHVSLAESEQTDITHPAHKTLTYFENNQGRMNYAHYLEKGYPIGSGVTEAACKVVVKQRLAASGMKWKTDNIQFMLLLRGLVCTKTRWRQFWNNIDRHGIA
jgi:hypothetical protein